MSKLVEHMNLMYKKAPEDMSLFLFMLLSLLATSCQKDKTPPIIKIGSEVYNEAQAIKGDTIIFDVSADDESGIQELILLKDGELLQKVTDEKLNYEWYTANVDTGRHHFTIKTTDNEGNQSKDYLWVYVNDITFITVEGGNFLMGSEEGEDNAKPPHTVTLDSYQIMATEVTIGQFVCFLNETNCPKDGWVNGKRYFYDNWANGIFVIGEHYYKVFAGQENHPIYFITWDGAKAFGDWLDGRLPTEAEWEFACRGGNLSQGYLYSGSNNVIEVAQLDFEVNYYVVATKKPNELGIYDMSGGVLEWCSDYYQEDYYQFSPENNPQGPESPGEEILYVRRGNASPKDAEGCTYYFREFEPPAFSIGGKGLETGFRIVKDIK